MLFQYNNFLLIQHYQKMFLYRSNNLVTYFSLKSFGVNPFSAECVLCSLRFCVSYLMHEKYFFIISTEYLLDTCSINVEKSMCDFSSAVSEIVRTIVKGISYS